MQAATYNVREYKNRFGPDRRQVVVTPTDGRDGLKGPACYLCEYVRGVYTHRQRGFIMSRRKLARLRWLDAAGYRPRIFADQLKGPDGQDDAPDPTLAPGWKPDPELLQIA